MVPSKLFLSLMPFTILLIQFPFSQISLDISFCSSRVYFPFREITELIIFITKLWNILQVRLFSFEPVELKRNSMEMNRQTVIAFIEFELLVYYLCYRRQPPVVSPVVCDLFMHLVGTQNVFIIPEFKLSQKLWHGHQIPRQNGDTSTSLPTKSENNFSLLHGNNVIFTKQTSRSYSIYQVRAFVVVVVIFIWYVHCWTGAPAKYVWKVWPANIR